MDSMIKLPAVGGEGRRANRWNHKGRSCISQIFISYDNIQVYGLQFMYEHDDTELSTTSSLSEIIGTMNMENSHFRTVQLDYPQEFLTCINIYEHLGSALVNSGFGISFETNMGNKHGPFSPGTDVLPISYHLGNNNQFGGFHGFINESIPLSIGVYVQPKTFVKKQPLTVKEESDTA